MKTMIATFTDRLRPIIAPAQGWFQQRPPREQMALKVLSAALALTLVYVLFWQPLMNWHNSATQLYQSNAKLLSWIDDNAAAIRAASRRPANSSGTMASGDWIAQLSRSASTAGVSLRGFTPEGEQGVRIQLEAQPFAETLAWLQTLEGQGVRVSSVEFSSTSATGLVNVRATLSRG
ncbi:MAG: type II secretion system protein M [Gammaproteobacteria bacterium HGW-Gammaproteobacteria-14]|nr:MAG: type II secretion system protein M [Gammaproteobacteria bacterium HGW-Gammaproteobacteria-14]